jgi:hypothetical protein
MTTLAGRPPAGQSSPYPALVRSAVPLPIRRDGVAHRDTCLTPRTRRTGTASSPRLTPCSTPNSRRRSRSDTIGCPASSSGNAGWEAMTLASLPISAGEGVDVCSILLVSRPYQQRRAFATCKKLCPEVEVRCGSRPLSLDEYIENIGDTKRVVNMLVGDIQRITEYAKRGFASSKKCHRRSRWPVNGLSTPDSLTGSSDDVESIPRKVRHSLVRVIRSPSAQYCGDHVEGAACRRDIVYPEHSCAELRADHQRGQGSFQALRHGQVEGLADEVLVGD